MSEPRCEHALVLTPWGIVEDLLEALAPRNASKSGQAAGRHISGVRAVVLITEWGRVVDDVGDYRDGAVKPFGTSFRTDTVFIVNAPLPDASDADVTLVLNGPRAGEGFIMVLSAADVESLMLTLTVLWSKHAKA